MRRDANQEIHPAKPAGWNTVGVPGVPAGDLFFAMMNATRAGREPAPTKDVQSRGEEIARLEFADL